MALTQKEQGNIIVSKAMKAASARRTATKVIAIVLAATLVLSGGAWGIITFIEANSMMVSINDKKEGLALSTTSTFEQMTTKINMKGPERMDAYTYSWFEQEKLLGAEGPHHGSGYFCYSFYLKNISPTTACEYTFGVRFIKDTKNISAATRIMIIESDEGCENETYLTRVFATAKADGTAEYVSYNECEETQTGLSLPLLNGANGNLLNTNVTQSFVGEVYDEETSEDLGYYALRESGKRLSHDAYVKYTIVIWLEGTDLQCVDDILGGKCSMQFEFSIDKYTDVEYYGE